MSAEMSFPIQPRPAKDKPWLRERSRYSWKDKRSGLDCLIRRNESAGHLCGYVGVDETHPWYEKDCNWDDETFGWQFPDSDNARWEFTNQAMFYNLVCHGGITFCGFFNENIKNKKLWWFGFDCAHTGDMSPYSPNIFNRAYSIYRTVEYVKGECESLARGLFWATRMV